MADLNLIPENCQRCEDEESITAKAVIPPHPASSYVETYVGRAVPTGQYRIDRPSGPLTSLYDKGGRLDIAVTNGAIVIHTQRLKSDPGGNLLS